MNNVEQCNDCKEYDCICNDVDSFFNDVKYLPKKKEFVRCDACFFAPCRCAEGHRERLKKL